MILRGHFKSDAKGNLAGKPYAIDLGLDSIYVQVSTGEAVYSDYISLGDHGLFKAVYAVADFDKHSRVIGFTIEGLLDQAKASSLKTRLEIDLGIFAFRYLSRAVRESIVQYLQDYLTPLIDSKGHLLVATAYA